MKIDTNADQKVEQKRDTFYINGEGVPSEDSR